MVSQPLILQKLALLLMTSSNQKGEYTGAMGTQIFESYNLPITKGNWPEKSYPSSWRVAPQLPILQKGRDFLAIRSSCPWPVPTWPAGCRCLCRQVWPVSQSLHDLLWQQDSPYPFGQKKVKSFLKVESEYSLFSFFLSFWIQLLDRYSSKSWVNSRKLKKSVYK